MNKHYEPQLVSVLREGYTLKQFVSDLSAGILVGIVAIPLAIAFAIASDVNPAQGITTAVVAGLAISIFSGSRFQIGGPPALLSSSFPGLSHNMDTAALPSQHSWLDYCLSLWACSSSA